MSFRIVDAVRAAFALTDTYFLEFFSGDTDWRITWMSPSFGGGDFHDPSYESDEEEFREEADRLAEAMSRMLPNMTIHTSADEMNWHVDVILPDWARYEDRPVCTQNAPEEPPCP